MQILKEPDTFRDHVTPETQQLFDRARAACLSMWHDTNNASSPKVDKGFAATTTATASSR